MMKRIFAIVLILTMLLSMGTMFASAEEIEDGGVNTYNGEEIPFSDWVNLFEGTWTEENGVITGGGDAEWLLLGYTKKLSGNYIIEFDVKQPDMNKNLQICMGFEVNEGDNYTSSGLTFELHNAGIGRLYDTVISRQSQEAYGGCNNSFGGHQTYSPTTEWIHVKIQRVENVFTVEYYDGTLYTIRCALDGYNGGYLVLGSQNYRKVSYKNITIQDNLEIEMDVEEPNYPEDPGSLSYTFNGNKYGEWITNDNSWQADGKYFTQNSTETGEKIAYLNTDKMRNFRLKLNYEILSEGEGYFGLGFRKGNGTKPYQETLGYALLFKLSESGKKLTVIDYLGGGDTGLDGLSHEFEMAGNLELSSSGNEICVWLDGNLVANVKNNGYSSGYLSLFTQECSVKFSDIQITTDELMTRETRELVEAADNFTQDDTAAAVEALQIYEALNDFQKSLFPDTAKVKMQTLAAQTNGNNGNHMAVWIVAGVVVAMAVVSGALWVIKRKKKTVTE